MRLAKAKSPQGKHPRAEPTAAAAKGGNVAAAGTVRLKIKAIPNASDTAVVGRLGEAWKIRVNAPPEDGKANKALTEFLAEKLSLPRSAVIVLAGASSREKTIAIEGLPPELIAARLEN